MLNLKKPKYNILQICLKMKLGARSLGWNILFEMAFADVILFKLTFLSPARETSSEQQCIYSWSEIGRTNLIVHRDITSYNPTSFDNTSMLSPRLNG